MKKIIALLMVLSMATLLFAGCGAKEETKKESTTTETTEDAKEDSKEEMTEEKETIKFGMLGAQTGDIAIYGIAVRDGAQLAIDEINAAGGVDGQMLELIPYDTEGDPTKAITLFNRLVDQDGIHALIGPTFSGESLTVGPIADQKGIPMLSPTATNADVTIDLDYVYRACFIDPYQGKVAAKFASEELGATKAVIFRNVGNDYAVGLADNFAGSFTGEIVADEGYTNEDNDFKAIITKIADLEPDVIFIPDYKQMVGLIASQIQEAGLDVVLLGGDGWDGVQVDYPEAMEGNFFTNHYATDDDAEIIQSFIAKYEEAYGETPNALAALAYDAAKIMAESVGAAGTTDGAAVLEKLAATQFDGVTGHIQFDENGDTFQKEAVIIKITGGDLAFETKMSE